MIFKNVWISALVIAMLVTILVYINTPRVDIPGYEINKNTLALKTFVISYAIALAIFYFTSGGKEDVIAHMIQGDPTF